MRVSLGLLLVRENALCCAARCGRATRDADRAAVLMRKGESLLAMVLAVSSKLWKRGQLRVREGIANLRRKLVDAVESISTSFLKLG